VVKEAKAAATKALELAAANEAVVVAASALALQLGDEPDAVMKGVEITLAIKFVYVAFPLQPTPKSSHSSKAAGLEFLGGLGARWPTFLPAARAACVAASAAASADDAAADAAAVAAASLAPPGRAHRVARLEHRGDHRPRRDERGRAARASRAPR
jgi:hypothetical protein